MSTTTAKKIVTVWYDETSDATDPKWIVDTDIAGGGQSSTIDTFDEKDEAVEFARDYAAKKGLPIEIRD